MRLSVGVPWCTGNDRLMSAATAETTEENLLFSSNFMHTCITVPQGNVVPEDYRVLGLSGIN